MTEQTPTCPVCSLPMKARTSKHGAFWGCANYPRCKGTRTAFAKAHARCPDCLKQFPCDKAGSDQQLCPDCEAREAQQFTSEQPRKVIKVPLGESSRMDEYR